MFRIPENRHRITCVTPEYPPEELSPQDIPLEELSPCQTLGWQFFMWSDTGNQWTGTFCTSQKMENLVDRLDMLVTNAIHLRRQSSTLVIATDFFFLFSFLMKSVKKNKNTRIQVFLLSYASLVTTTSTRLNKFNRFPVVGWSGCYRHQSYIFPLHTSHRNVSDLRTCQNCSVCPQITDQCSF